MRMVWGDPDVVHAHVDACLAHSSVAGRTRSGGHGASGSHSQSTSTPELEVDAEDGDVNVDLNGPSDTEDIWEETTTPEGHVGLRLRLGGLGSASRGAAQRLGFVVGSSGSGLGGRRGAGAGDADEEMGLDVDVDVDGDDEGAFGGVQFGEDDVIKLAPGGALGVGGEEADVDVDGDGEGPEGETLEQQVSLLEEAERQLARARADGDAQATIRALEILLRLRTTVALYPSHSPNTSALPTTATVTNQFTCRICLDAYTEPTISIGCWHACCKECWLRCLGSTKLCPICMRITGVGELRRVYL